MKRFAFPRQADQEPHSRSTRMGQEKILISLFPKDYWNANIKSSRAKRKRICTERPEENLQLNESSTVESMTAGEIKVMLKEREEFLPALDH